MWVSRTTVTEQKNREERLQERVRGVSALLDAAHSETRAALELANGLQSMVRDLVNRPAPTPVIVPPFDPTPLLEQMRLMIAPPTVDVSNKQADEMATMMMDSTAGAGRGNWYPDTEFDDFLAANGDTWPTRGGWVNGQPTPTTSSQSPVHAMTEDGKLIRMDGTKPFVSGEGGPPPVGGIE